MTHRIGIIGLGTVGTRFVEQFDLHPDFEVVAAWDADESARARHRAATPIADGPDQVVGAADAVYIAVPPHHHRAYVDACLESGTAVFCEKPLGTDVAESEQLVARVETSRLPAGVNFVYAAAPAATDLVDRIHAGEIGTPVSAELRLHFARWPRDWQAAATWLSDREQGGWLREVASHHLFLAERALGTCTVENAHVEFPDGVDGHLSERSVLASLRSGDVPLSLLGTSGGASPDLVEFTIRGEAASLRLADWYRLESSDGGPWRPVSSTDRQALATAAYAAQLGELSALLTGNETRIATFGEGLAVQRTVEAMLATD